MARYQEFQSADITIFEVLNSLFFVNIVLQLYYLLMAQKVG